MNKSETIGKLAVALCKFQGAMKSVEKTASNPFFKSKYADLASIWDAIREPLTKNELSIVQVPSGSNLSTVLLHSSGEWISGEQPLTPVKQDPQAVGSAITYARRYGLSAILGVAADEDDDGNAASDKKAEPKPASNWAPNNAGHQAQTTQQLDDRPPTQAQLKRLFAICSQHKVPEITLKKFMQDNYGKSSTGALTRDEYQSLCTLVESGGVKPEILRGDDVPFA